MNRSELEPRPCSTCGQLPTTTPIDAGDAVLGWLCQHACGKSELESCGVTRKTCIEAIEAWNKYLAAHYPMSMEGE